MSKFSELDIEHKTEEFKKLRRQIEDYIRKYATLNQLKEIAKQLKI